MTEHTEPAIEPPLTAVEMRVLGSLIEKEVATPEAYPLTLNAVVTACNQKTSRDPVMQLEPGEVERTLRGLEQRGLARLIMGARADRWEHQADKALQLIPAQRVLLGLLLLRGAQTVAELYGRSARLHPFKDAEAVQYQLQRLITLGHAVRLPRQAGQREERYMHLLAGPIDTSALAAAPARPASRADRTEALLERIEELEARLDRVEQRLADLE